MEKNKMDRQVEKEGQEVWREKREKSSFRTFYRDRPFIVTNENLAVHFKELHHVRMTQILSTTTTPLPLTKFAMSLCGPRMLSLM